MAKYFVQRSWHAGPTCNKWCVWGPHRTLYRVCESKEQADTLAKEMNERPTQLQMDWMVSEFGVIGFEFAPRG